MENPMDNIIRRLAAGEITEAQARDETDQYVYLYIHDVQTRQRFVQSALQGLTAQQQLDIATMADMAVRIGTATYEAFNKKESENRAG